MTAPTLMGQGEALLEFGINAQTMLALVAVCSVRVYAAMMVLPATSDSLLQGIVRNGLALTFGLYIAWGQPIDLVEKQNTMQMLVLVGKEGLIGVLLGFAMGTVFWVAEGVGVLIDNQAGFNNVQQNNPLSGQQSTPVGNLLSQLAITGFYMLGGLTVFASLLFDSFHWWPLRSAAPSWPQLLDQFLPGQLRSYTESVLKIAGPVVMVLVLIDLGLGLLTKAAEKLEPSSLGQPIKGAVAVLMLVMLVAVFFEQVRTPLTLAPLSRQLQGLVVPPVQRP